MYIYFKGQFPFSWNPLQLCISLLSCGLWLQETEADSVSKHTYGRCSFRSNKIICRHSLDSVLLAKKNRHTHPPPPKQDHKTRLNKKTQKWLVLSTYPALPLTCSLPGLPNLIQISFSIYSVGNGNELVNFREVRTKPFSFSEWIFFFFCRSMGILSNTAKIVLFLRWSCVAQVKFLNGPHSF